MIRWRSYRALALARCKVLLSYRAAALAGLATQTYWGLIRVMIMEAYYRSAAPQPMTLAQLVSYIWLGQSTFRILPWTPDPDIRQQVRTGAVAMELVKPVDLYGYWYARALAAASAPTLLRAVPMMLLALAVLGLQPPASLASGAAWLVTTFGAVLLAASIAALQSVMLLVTVSGEGMAQLVPICTYILSGLVVPMPLLPPALQAVLDWLPFRGVMDTPLRLWSGHLPVSALPALLAHQLIWTALIVLAGRAMLARILHRMEVHGG